MRRPRCPVAAAGDQYQSQKRKIRMIATMTIPYRTSLRNR
jgi:hypothetical protein